MNIHNINTKQLKNNGSGWRERIFVQPRNSNQWVWRTAQLQAGLDKGSIGEVGLWEKGSWEEELLDIWGSGCWVCACVGGDLWPILQMSSKSWQFPIFMSKLCIWPFRSIFFLLMCNSKICTHLNRSTSSQHGTLCCAMSLYMCSFFSS